jgi:hypothetical protein
MKQCHIDTLDSLPLHLWQELPVAKIAKQFSVPVSVVYSYRKKNTMPEAPHKPRSGRPKKYNWKLFNPSRPDAINAAIIGCSEEVAKKHRTQRLGVKRKRGRKAFKRNT